jgi:hypothetical protein
MAEIANIIWADGPASNPFMPEKPRIRAWGTWIEQIITAFTSNGGLVYSSLAVLNADLSKAANSMAWVIGDPIAGNNGVYGKVGASGTGSWTRRSDLPFSFIISNNAGAGTPNSIQATTALPVSASSLVWLNIAQSNTASPVTVSFNGATSLSIRTNSGNNVVAGGLVAGMIVLGIVSGSTFRLVSDQASSAIVAAAESAATAAAQSASEAAAWAATVNLPGLGAPLSVMRTNLAGTGRENYDPLATATLASTGQPTNNDFAFPFRDGKYQVANRWADGPFAVEVANRDSSLWTLSNLTRSVSSFTATLLPTTTVGQHTAVVAAPLTLASGDIGYASIIARANGYKFLRVTIDGYDEIVVDLSTASIVKAPSVPSSLMLTTVVSLMGSWVYIAVRYTAAGAFAFNVSYSVNDNTGVSGAPSFAGNGTSSVQVHTASVRQQVTVPSYGILKNDWRGGNSYDIEEIFINGNDGYRYRRTGQGSPVRWSAWALTIDEASIGAPVYLLKEAMQDRNDVRDYLPGINLYSTSGYAVDKFKAAHAAYDDSRPGDGVLRVPRGRIRFGDSFLMSKMNFRMEGAGRQTFDRMAGETTGGAAHPVGGTQIESVGPGSARRWTDIDGGGAADAPRTPLVVAAMPGTKVRGMSFVTPRTGANIWSDGLMVLGGANDCDFEDFNSYGGFTGSGVYISPTMTKFHTAMISMINGYGIGPAIDANLMATGPTNNKFSRFESSGVSAFVVQGTTRGKGSAGQYDGTTWLWGANGLSDTTVENFRFYQFGDQAARLDRGALIYLDYRLFTGGTPNSSGQNIAFRRGRLDGAGRWAIYWENMDVVWFEDIFGETSAAWFSATGKRNVIQRTGAAGGERYFSKSKMFFNYLNPSVGSTETTMPDNYWDGRNVF